MVNKNKEIYICFACNKNTLTFHEVFFGTSKRKKSIKYCLQIPLCNDCHCLAHGQRVIISSAFQFLDQLEIKKQICKYLEIDFYKADFEINAIKSDWLESSIQNREKLINSLLI